VIPTIRMMDGTNEFVQIDNLLKNHIDLIDVNRTIRYRLTQLLPFTQIPFERFGMDIVAFGFDVVVNGVCQRDRVGPLERDRQLVCHLQFAPLRSKGIDSM
jgi:hypothetical protein